MKNKKIFIGLILIMLLSFILTGVVKAWTPDWNAVEGQSAGNTTNAVYSVMGTIINIVTIVGAGIAIIMLIVIGIKYMSSSPEAKGEVKKQLPHYVIGAVILFSASGILKILQMFVEANINSI